MGSNNPKGCNLRVLKMLNDTAGNTWGVKEIPEGLKPSRLRN